VNDARAFGLISWKKYMELIPDRIAGAAEVRTAEQNASTAELDIITVEQDRADISMGVVAMDAESIDMMSLEVHDMDVLSGEAVNEATLPQEKLNVARDTAPNDGGKAQPLGLRGPGTSEATSKTQEVEPAEVTVPKDSADAAMMAYRIAYRTALGEMGACALEVTPAIGGELQYFLGGLEKSLAEETDCEVIASAEQSVQMELREWSGKTAAHLQEKADEVKELLLMMASTADSVGERDKRCAYRINEVTTRLEVVATLDDLTHIRTAIVKNTEQLKTSIDIMMMEGEATIARLTKEVARYQAKARDAEYAASVDVLTGLRTRNYVERLIQQRIEDGVPTCVAIVDIDGFKYVNDKNGHMIGDELLKQFSANLRSVCRESDMIGRWGGDEFIILLDCAGAQAKAQVERLMTWICRDYAIPGKFGPLMFRVAASIGMAEHTPGESMADLFDRADANMYEQKNPLARDGRARGAA
jgi:diguanylate cyclase (GGDEF)-like protein